MAEKYPFEPWKRDAEKLNGREESKSIKYSDWLKQDGPETIRAIHDEILDFYANKAEKESPDDDDEIKQIHDESLAFYVSSSVARHKKVVKNARLMNNSFYEDDAVIKITTEIRIERKPKRIAKTITCLEEQETGDQVFLDENRNILFVRKGSAKVRDTDNS